MQRNRSKFQFSPVKPAGDCRRIRQGTPGEGRVISAEEAMQMVKPGSRGILEAGHLLTIRPGVTLQRVKLGAAPRYRVCGE